jgi:hypothetical protein
MVDEVLFISLTVVQLVVIMTYVLVVYGILGKMQERTRTASLVTAMQQDGGTITLNLWRSRMKNPTYEDVIKTLELFPIAPSWAQASSLSDIELKERVASDYQTEVYNNINKIKNKEYVNIIQQAISKIAY